LTPEPANRRDVGIRLGAGALGVVAIVIIVLALAGVFSSDDVENVARPAPAAQPQGAGGPAPTPEREAGTSRPKLTTVRVGGRPTALAAGQGSVWVADSFERRGTVLESERAKPTSFELAGPASDVIVTEAGAYYALPEQQLVERRELDDPGATGETIETDGFPSVLAGAAGSVFALADKSIELIDVDGAEVVDRFELDGFASSLAVGEGYLWVVKDNSEVARLDPSSGDADGEPVDVAEAFGVATGEGAVWVVSASGAITRIDPESLQATVAPSRVPGALDVAAGLGSAWVTSRERTLTRLDPDTLEPIGKPLPVGDEAASVGVGDDVVWIANGGDGTLTRIEP
jgi:hypothetical protein